MSRKLILIFIALIFPTLVLAFTPAQTRANYARCMNWLRLSHAEKVKAVQRTGQDFGTVLAACQYEQRRGLKGMLADERAYQRGGGSGSGSNACSGARDCGSGEHCLGGRCEDTINSCSSNVWCAAGESCNNGRCG